VLPAQLVAEPLQPCLISSKRTSHIAAFEVGSHQESVEFSGVGSEPVSVAKRLL